jgi:Ferredoxin-dependent bilin reductase
MDLEAPHPAYTTTTTTPQHPSLKVVVRTGATAATRTTTTSTAPAIRIPAVAASEGSGFTDAAAAAPAYFQRFWDTQLGVMADRLRNLEEIPLSSTVPVAAATTTAAKAGQQHAGSMALVENDSSVMITKAFRSDEYSYIRMTLLKGRHSQVFTSVWYPMSPDVPILACDLLQFGGGTGGSQQRHLCIVDYQPVIVPSDDDSDDASAADTIAQHHHHQAIADHVGAIRAKYPGLHGQMSKRFYPEASPYFSRHMLLGRHVGSHSSRAPPPSAAKDAEAVPSYETPDAMVRDVYEAYQSYTDRHVSWAQQQQQQLTQQTQEEKDSEDGADGNRRSLRVERHACYDKFSSKYDPALPMLSHMYGSGFADAYVHDVLFPLSRRRT